MGKTEINPKWSYPHSIKPSLEVSVDSENDLNFSPPVKDQYSFKIKEKKVFLADFLRRK